MSIDWRPERCKPEPEDWIGQREPPRTLAERLRVPGQVPVTERNRDPCPCCGFVHAPKPPLRFGRLPGPQEPDGYVRPNPLE